jgi:hypothetical protein
MGQPRGLPKAKSHGCFFSKLATMLYQQILAFFALGGPFDLPGAWPPSQQTWTCIPLKRTQDLSSLTYLWYACKLAGLANNNKLIW